MEITKDKVWFVNHGPVRISSEPYTEGGNKSYLLNASVGKERRSKGGFLSHEDAFGYGLLWVIEQLQLLLDGFLVLRQLEYKDD